MKLAFELITIAIFFAVYKFYGMYPAVATAMLLYSLQIIVQWLLNHSIEKLQWFTLALVLLLGGATLLLQDETFFKWKPTVVYLLFASVFIGSHFIGDKPVIQRLLEPSLSLPDKAWRRLSGLWTLFFLIIACSNVYVIYSFSTDTWVNFKLFGVMGLTLAFMFAQGVYIMRLGGKLVEQSPTTSVTEPGND